MKSHRRNHRPASRSVRRRSNRTASLPRLSRPATRQLRVRLASDYVHGDYRRRSNPRRTISLGGDVLVPISTTITRGRKSYVRTYHALPGSKTALTSSRSLLCARRRIRREVIIASGRGGGHHARPRRTESSYINC